MKKSYLVMAAAAALFAACSSNDLVEEKQSPQITQQTDELAVDFDVYVNRGTTRAGENGAITTGTLQASAKGFGVFGYYTNGESYTGSSRPDFFYNQKVTYASPKWTYSPIKYWPNEFGNDAISDQVDKVTLFAYAPWVDVTPLTGLVKDDGTTKYAATNITGMTRNNATGDPMIKYVSSMMSDNSVDLCYGVAAEAFTSSVSSPNYNSVSAQQPYIDVVKPGTDANSKIKFDFKHALAQLNVTIDAKVTDLTSTVGDEIQTAYTRIWVRSITFEGITQTGALNLNSPGDSPNWYDVNGTSLITTGSLTVYDGRKDGREANEIATSETPATLNPEIVQSAAYNASGAITAPTQLGVVKAPQNLFCKADGTKNTDVNAPIFVIPTKEKMKVTIVYDVETADENLATVLSDGSRKGSTIENRIYKTIDAFNNITAGKKYILNLHLGMRSVDFDASVTDWIPVQSEIDLPSNLMTFTAAASGTGSVTLTADATEFDFAVNGLNAAETITPALSGTPLSSASAAAATADDGGLAKFHVTNITANTKSTKEASPGTITITSASTKSVVITVNQLAKPLNLQSLAYVGGTPNKLTFTTDPSDLANANAIKSAGYIKVFKNGTEITTSCTMSTTAKEIELPGPGTTGDIYTVYMKANDTKEEFASKKIE